MSTIKDYIDYFEQLCTNHVELAHTPDAPIFQTISIEEALGDFRSKLKEKSFAFRLIAYTLDIPSTRNYDEGLEKQGGFYIMHYFKRGNTESQINAQDACEKIGLEVIAKMISDSRDGHELFNYSFDNAQSVNAAPTPITGDNSYTGWLFTFNFSTFFNTCVNSDRWQ